MPSGPWCPVRSYRLGVGQPHAPLQEAAWVTRDLGCVFSKPPSTLWQRRPPSFPLRAGHAPILCPRGGCRPRACSTSLHFGTPARPSTFTPSGCPPPPASAECPARGAPRSDPLLSWPCVPKQETASPSLKGIPRPPWAHMASLPGPPSLPAWRAAPCGEEAAPSSKRHGAMTTAGPGTGTALCPGAPSAPAPWVTPPRSPPTPAPRCGPAPACSGPAHGGARRPFPWRSQGTFSSVPPGSCSADGVAA